MHHLCSIPHVSIIIELTEVFGFAFVYLILLKHIINRDPWYNFGSLQSLCYFLVRLFLMVQSICEEHKGVVWSPKCTLELFQNTKTQTSSKRNIWGESLSIEIYLSIYLCFLAGYGSNQSHSCRPTPQPQQFRIQAEPVTYTTAMATPDPKPTGKPRDRTCKLMVPRQICFHCTRTATPQFIF